MIMYQQQHKMQLTDFMQQRESGKLEGVRRLFEQDDPVTVTVTNMDEEESEPSHAHAFPRKRDWSQLARDVCRVIAEKAAFGPHLDKFALACKEWYNISKEVPPPLMLFLPFNETDNTCRFTGPKEDNAPYDLTLPELKGYGIFGCANGWMGLINDRTDMVLFNPMTRVRVPLPRFTTDRIEEYLHIRCLSASSIPHAKLKGLVSKLALSSNPDPKSATSCLVAVKLRPGAQLAVCRLGDQSWTVITTTKEFPRGDPGFHDIIFHKDTMYAVKRHSNYVYEIDCSASASCGVVSIKKIPFPFDENCMTADLMYIVMSSENILLVMKHKDLDRVGTARRPTLVDKYTVHQLDDKRKKWKDMKDLGGRSLFIGKSLSMSVSSKESRFQWCRPDCIYFLDDDICCFYVEDRGYQCDNGIFSVVENRVISRFDVQHSLTFWPAPALWYLPNV